MFKTHLTVVESSAAAYPNQPAFRTPLVDPDTNQITRWLAITYQQFHEDVLASARYWSHTLTSDNIAPRSVIGIWQVLSPLLILQ